MQNTRQTVVSIQGSTNAPVELSLDQLQQVAGGRGPHDNWAATLVVAGPHDNWATAAMGPHDNW